MMPTVDVIVDPDNDVATVKALHALAAREPGVLTVSIAPGSDAQPAVVWAILRALGKRIEQLPQTSFKVFWMDAERWLVAHQIAEMVVLSAQHLRGGTAEQLERHVARLRMGEEDRVGRAPHRRSRMGRQRRRQDQNSGAGALPARAETAGQRQR